MYLQKTINVASNLVCTVVVKLQMLVVHFTVTATVGCCCCTDVGRFHDEGALVVACPSVCPCLPAVVFIWFTVAMQQLQASAGTESITSQTRVEFVVR